MDKFGVYKQEAETKLDLNIVLLYGREETGTKTQTEHTLWDCKNSTSTSDAALRWDGTGAWREERGGAAVPRACCTLRGGKWKWY